jgi:hypothetical protein
MPVPSVHTDKMQYHRSCYKCFTSKHNFSTSAFSTTAQNVSKPTVHTTSVSSLVLTRSSKSSDINWSVCVFCQCKTCKRYKKIHKISSDERTKRLWTWQHWLMMAKWYTELLMMGLKKMQYIMLLVWHITYSKELRTTVCCSLCECATFLSIRRQKFRKKSSGSWVKVNIFLWVSKSSLW